MNSIIQKKPIMLKRILISLISALVLLVTAVGASAVELPVVTDAGNVSLGNTDASENNDYDLPFLPYNSPYIEASANFQTIEVTLYNASDYSAMAFGVWNDTTKSSAEWFGGSLNNGNWYFSASLTAGVGEYKIHAYGTKNGESEFVAEGSVTIKAVTDAKITAAANGNYVKGQITNAAEYTDVVVGIWNTSGGAATWHTGTLVGGVWYFEAEVTDGSGEYRFDAYGTKNGASVPVASGSVNVNSNVSPEITAAANGNYVKGQITNAAEYTDVVVGIWNTSGGTATWHTGTLVGGVWYFEAEVTDGSGEYRFDAYGTKNGASVPVASGSVAVN